MRLTPSAAAKLCSLLTLLFIAPACLSIGGKTYSTESPETDARLSSLESRVGHLEQSMQGEHVSSGPPMSMSAPIPMP